MNKCPICHFASVGAFVTTCPNCKADLTPFVLIDELEEKCVLAVKQKIALDGELLLQKKRHEREEQRYRGNTNRLLLLFCLLPLCYLLFRKTPPPNTAAVDELLKTKVLLRQTIAERDTILSQKIQQITYEVRAGDNLEGIGKLFFNNPLAGYRIAKDNKIDANYYSRHLEPGKKLTIIFR